MNQKRDAILMVSFGTSFDHARESCIGAVERRVAQEFPAHLVRRAFTSGMIIHKLAQRGIEIDTVAQALEKLAEEEIQNVIIQPTHLIPGIEYEKLIGEIAEYRHRFASVKTGRPLLDSDEDIAKMAEIIAGGIVREPDECLILMGHGSDHRANRIYGKVDQAFRDQGYDNVFVGTVEAQPDAQAVLTQAGGYQKAVMAPLMLVAGDHAVNDMAGDEADSWKSMFERAGIAVRTVMRGMGEYEAIQDMYVDHIRRA